MELDDKEKIPHLTTNYAEPFYFVSPEAGDTWESQQREGEPAVTGICPSRHKIFTYHNDSTSNT